MTKHHDDGEFSPLLRLALHAGVGAALGIVCASVLVIMNIGGLKDLMLATGEPFVPMITLQVSLASIGTMIEVSWAVFKSKA